MYARSTTIHANPDSIDAGIAHVRDEVLPRLQDIRGCIGLSMLVDRETGRCIATSAWESEDAMRAAADEVAPLRDRAAQLMGGTPEVQEWEIAVMHRDHNTPEGACARATWLEMDPSLVDRGLEVFREGVLPQAEKMPGFCSASMLVDRRTGRAVAAVSFESREALVATRPMADKIRKGAVDQIGATVTEVAEFDLALAHLHVPELV